MIAVYIDNKDVTEYIVSNDFGITISIESEVELLAYTDNFTLTFTNNIDDLFDSIGGKYFELYYENELIIVGNIIKVSENVKDETIDLEFGTIDYLYSQGSFSTYDIENNIENIEEYFGHEGLPGSDIVTQWDIEYEKYIINQSGNIYQMLKNWRDSVKAENNLINLSINEEENISNFPAYYSYGIEEIKDRYGLIDLVKDLSDNEYGFDFVGFWAKTKRPISDDNLFDITYFQYYTNKIYFGRIKVSILGPSDDTTAKIEAILYPLVGGEIDANLIDVDNPINIQKTSDEILFWDDPPRVKVKEDTNNSDYPNPFNGDDENGDGEYYYLIQSFKEETGDLKDNNDNIINFLKEKLKYKYFSVEAIKNDEYTLKVKSMYKHDIRYLDASIFFFLVQIDNDDVLIKFDIQSEDIFHYYYENAEGGDLLKDLAVISDKALIFRGNELIICDREGLGSVSINEEYILDKETRIQSIVIDKQKVSNIGVDKPKENGIVVLDGESPFNVKDKIETYYNILQDSEKQITELTILSDGLSSKDLIGKSINDYGMIQEVTYNDETVEIRAEKRL